MASARLLLPHASFRTTELVEDGHACIAIGKCLGELRRVSSVMEGPILAQVQITTRRRNDAGVHLLRSTRRSCATERGAARRTRSPFARGPDGKAPKPERLPTESKRQKGGRIRAEPSLGNSLLLRCGFCRHPELEQAEFCTEPRRRQCGEHEGYSIPMLAKRAVPGGSSAGGAHHGSQGACK